MEIYLYYGLIYILLQRERNYPKYSTLGLRNSQLCNKQERSERYLRPYFGENSNQNVYFHILESFILSFINTSEKELRNNRFSQSFGYPVHFTVMVGQFLNHSLLKGEKVSLVYLLFFLGYRTLYS